MKHENLMMKIMGLLAFGTLAVLTSCTMESSDNGSLDGFWHLERIDTLSTGNSGDYSQKRIFWGVEHKLISIKDVDSGGEKFYLRFEQTSDQLQITKAYIDHWHQDKGENGGDIPVEEPTDDLRQLGVNALPETFQKEALDGGKMILKSSMLRLYFKKF